MRRECLVMQEVGFKFSDFFKSLLKEAGLNYGDFSKVSGIARRTVATWANSDVIPAAASFKVSLQALARRVCDNKKEEKEYINKNYNIYLSIADTVNYERNKRK